jgi:3-dehydrosphinganine reductase
MRYRDRHMIITGGSSGIGLATARLLAQQGANITIIARDPAKLQQARAEIEAARADPAQRVQTFSVDVTDQPRLEEAIAAAIGELGAPEALIASAGIAHPGYFLEIPLEMFKYTMELNYLGTVYAARAVVPAMRQHGRGQLVFISSGAGLIGIFGYTSYCPSKFALRGLAEALRAELKPSGIKVSVVYPPDTQTPQLEYENRTKPAETREISATASMWAAEDVARVIVDGMGKGRFCITPGLTMLLLARLNSLVVPFLNLYFDRIVARTQRRQAQK